LNQLQETIYYSSLLVSLKVSAVATLINLPIAILFAWLSVRRRVKFRILIEILGIIPLALPPVTIGFLLLIILGRNSPTGSLIHGVFGMDLIFTWWATSLAAAVVSYPLVYKAISVGFGSVDSRLELAARTLGADIFRTFFSITMPLAYRGVLAGIVAGFVRALSEFGATSVVGGNIPGETQTLPIAIYSSVLSGDNNAAIILSMMSGILAIATLLIHNWMSKKIEYNHGF